MLKSQAIEELVVKYMTAAASEKKRLLERMLETEGSVQSIYALVFCEKQRAALRALADACKRKAPREQIRPLVIRDAERLAAISDDKARKTAFALIGLCAPDECAGILASALKSENIRFVRPSIILALGNTSDPAKYLKGYVIEPGEDKHVREEAEALKKALSKGIEPQQLISVVLPEECTLTCISESALREELLANNCAFTTSRHVIGAYDVKTKHTDKLRCYLDSLYYIGDMGSYGQAAEALGAMGLKGAAYRVEAGHLSQYKRREIISDISNGLAEFGWYDNPSAYSFEIRCINGRMYAVFPDKRFVYRKQSIAASINPVAAASIMRLCLPYMKDNADVLDPFCGSATMLIERGYIKKANSLFGVDISPAAIKAACENRKASGLKIALIKGDILGYGGAVYDEIISNMPFGIRVSGHDSNIKLYAGFADRLLKLLKADGYAFLFTQEKKLLRSEMAKREFVIVKEEVFETGGLAPTLFIIKRGAKQ
jgi:predicted RNA methylase